MKLYHGTEDKELNLTETTAQNGLNIFYGMFFASSLSAAESHGSTVFEVEVDKEDILDYEKIPFFEETESIIKELYKDITEEELEELIELASGKSSFKSDIETERLAEILKVYEDDFMLEAFVDWECQNLSGYIAEKLGYKAVKMDDEHGTTYLVLPGNKINKIVED